MLPSARTPRVCKGGRCRWRERSPPRRSPRGRSAATRDGSTALCVLRVGGALFTAHAGDSRAVASVDGRALRLTKDHKPDLPEERKRIEALGGRVEFTGCWRVVADPQPGSRMKSALAVARSLGDFDFKAGKKKARQAANMRRRRRAHSGRCTRAAA